MKVLLMIYFSAFIFAALFLGMATDSVEIAKQIFAVVALVGFGFFVTIGHRLLAETIVDWYDARFGKDQ